MLATALALPGCAVGPNFHTPAAPQAPLTPDPLPKAAGKQVFVPGADIPGGWWSLFHSPELNALVAAALANNPSLTAAQAALLQSRETMRADEGVLLPSVGASLGAQRDQLSTASQAGFGGGGGSTAIKPYTLYDASLSVSYAVDVWGGARRAVENQAAQVDYQRDELEAAYLSLTGNVVTAAVQEASLKAQIAATQQVISAEQQELNILQTQVRLGGAAPTAVLQQQAVLAQAQAALPPLQAALAQTRNQLAALTGQMPGNFHEADFTLAALTLPADIPVSLPSAVVAQRPDIRAAADQLHAATAEVGVADAQMLPQITLSGDIGHEALTTGALFTPQTLLWSLVAGLTQPVFEGGELTAKRQAAIAALQGAGAQYQETVIAAFQNVADALSALEYDAAALAAAQNAASAARASLNVTQMQYNLGAQPFTAVLSAQTTFQTAELALAKAQAARLADTAALYVALGGGWWNRHDDAAPPCCGVIP
jgi:NodT family efflux transporter outer membrane factor (OMF) lipoprotein